MKKTIKEIHELIKEKYKNDISLATLRVWKHYQDERLNEVMQEFGITEIIKEKTGKKKYELIKK